MHNSETAVFKVKGAKPQTPSPLFHSYPFHFTAASLTAIPALPLCFYFPTSTPLHTSPVFLCHLFLIFLLQCFQIWAPGSLTRACQAVSDAGLGWDGRTCELASGLHISDQLGNLTTFPYHLFFLASSDLFLTTKRMAHQATDCATLFLHF